MYDPSYAQAGMGTNSHGHSDSSAQNPQPHPPVPHGHHQSLQHHYSMQASFPHHFPHADAGMPMPGVPPHPYYPHGYPGGMVPHVPHPAQPLPGRGGSAGFDRKRQRNAPYMRPGPHSQEALAPHQSMEDLGEPCKVIHMRNVSPELPQISLQNLVSGFGRTTNIVMLRQKRQALVEMESLDAARHLIDYYRTRGYAEVEGCRIYMRYSRHAELSCRNMSKALLVSMNASNFDLAQVARITPTIVHQIFSSYGEVEKIVILPRNETIQRKHYGVQALVQFDSIETADRVKRTLQGQPVTLGHTVHFTLDIQFSRLSEIKANSPHMSIDYTLPPGSDQYRGQGASASASPQRDSTYADAPTE